MSSDRSMIHTVEAVDGSEPIHTGKAFGPFRTLKDTDRRYAVSKFTHPRVCTYLGQPTV